MTIMGMSSIWYPVADIARAREFYRDVLNLNEVFFDGSKGIAAFAVGGGAPPLFLVQKDHDEPRGAVVGLNADDPAELLQRITTAGGQTDRRVDVGTDTIVHTFFDLDGNRLELTESRPTQS